MAQKCQLVLGSLSHYTLLQQLSGLIYNIFQNYIFLVDVLVSFLPLGQNPREKPLKRLFGLPSFGSGTGSILDSIHTLLVQSHWEPCNLSQAEPWRGTSGVEAPRLGASECVYICSQSF